MHSKALTNLKEKRRGRSDGVRRPKMRRQRQAMISQTIELGSFEDREDVKSWLKAEFQLSEPLAKVSTEYSLTDGQLRLWFKWLQYFTGQGAMPYTQRNKKRAGSKRLWRISQLKTALGWDDATLVNFIDRQIGRRKMPQSLYGKEASKVITGMDRILAEQPFKRKHEL